MRGPVLRPVLRLEVPDETLDAALGGRNEVDGLHGRQRLAVLVDRLHDGDTLRREVLLEDCGSSRSRQPNVEQNAKLLIQRTAVTFLIRVKRNFTLYLSSKLEMSQIWPNKHIQSELL